MGTEKKLKTRCYYTDYVNHMVRFYLTTPETLQMQGKRKADIENWIAVQDVWHKLGADDKQVLTEIYKAHFRLSEGVRMYCDKTGADKILLNYSAKTKRVTGMRELNRHYGWEKMGTDVTDQIDVPF